VSNGIGSCYRPHSPNVGGSRDDDETFGRSRPWITNCLPLEGAESAEVELLPPPPKREDISLFENDEATREWRERAREQRAAPYDRVERRKKKKGRLIRVWSGEGRRDELRWTRIERNGHVSCRDSCT